MRDFSIADLQQYEAVNMLCGDSLGEGIHRLVFRQRFDDGLVVKVAKNSDGVRANIEEFNTWRHVEFSENASKWFAKCLDISDYGTILIQAYIPPLPSGTYKIPTFFTDLKRDNFGITKDGEIPHVVCRDYGMHLLRENGMHKGTKQWVVK